MKNLLLLDINETLDDHRNITEIKRRYENNIETYGVAPFRKDIGYLKDFLEEYKDILSVVFFTSVGIRGQLFTADFLGLEDYYIFSRRKLYHKDFTGPISLYDIGIGGDKHNYLPQVIQYFSGKIDKIIWFEDSIPDGGQEAIDNIKSLKITHIGMKSEDSMENKVGEMRKILFN